MKAILCLSFLVTLVTYSNAKAQLPETLPSGTYKKAKKEKKDDNVEKPKLTEAQIIELRSNAIAGAKVWEQTATPISQVDFSTTPVESDGFPYGTEVMCKWKPDPKPHGKSRKFRCLLPDGEELKVKYSIKGKKDNAEVRTETLGSRLLNAFGFGSDRIHIVSKIRCFGCSLDPFKDDVDDSSKLNPDFSKYTDFEFVALERKFPGQEIKNEKGNTGISIQEMGLADENKGGSSPTEIGALYLMMAFLTHTDNKADNHQLLCVDGKDENCKAYRSIIHDSGVIMGGRFRLFDRKKGILFVPAFTSKALHFNEWNGSKIWDDKNDLTDCKLGMKADPSMPNLNMRISESSRKMVVEMLQQISDKQLRDLFNGIKIQEFSRLNEEDRDVEKWVQLFRKRQSTIEQKTCSN